ncbi:hypothetical protein [Alloactinosynnema sp. L-07]|uniref:hypothetical protein n=1 Tax=Alloactinosynnema sp. L-07 TaxID=1653480 RepID=UPI00065EF88D|nr:hypothetical protein [Alloactinosynnema sp. L-07]CRK56975.1 hypothetical protein [Alloactinosynnema sp. L-07]
MSAIVRSKTTGRVLHRTVTSKPQLGQPAAARCIICGWSQRIDPPGGRSEARALARAHLRWPDEWPVFHCGIAYHTTDPDHTDPAAARVGGARANASAWAVHDRSPAAARAARLATDDIVDRGLPTEAALSLAMPACDPTHRPAPSVALVVARHDVPGYSIAWIGDCRAYEVRGECLVPLTTDRAASSTVRHTHTSRPRGRLVLTAGDLHNAVPHDTLTALAVGIPHPTTSAHLIVAAGTRTGAADVTALVIDPVPTQ